MFSTILVPIDPSTESLRALKPARIVADSLGAELVVVTIVVDARDRPGTETHLQTTVEDYGVAVDRVVAYAHPFGASEGLSKLVDEFEDVLLVASTRGHSHTSGLLGSVTEKLLHDCAGVPAVLVGPKVDVDSFSLNGPIIACIDDTDASETVVAPVARFAGAMQLNPWIVTVLEPSNIKASVGPYGSSEPRIETGHLHVVADRMQEMGAPEVNWEVLHNKQPAMEIARFATSLNASFVAVATRKRSGVDRLVLGSVAMATVSKATCPVLAVHAEA
jgi:nucleotide-binding universal stress UspA family protein